MRKFIRYAHLTIQRLTSRCDYEMYLELSHRLGFQTLPSQLAHPPVQFPSSQEQNLPLLLSYQKLALPLQVFYKKQLYVAGYDL